MRFVGVLALLGSMVLGGWLATPVDALANSCSTGTVTTTSGRVCGKTKNWRGHKIESFLGIPYAETTAAENRWRAPIPKTPGGTVLRATQFGPACPQKIGEDSPYVQSEDCLSLNIWSPKGNKRKKPVMVFIHGGAFVEGTSQAPVYDGQRLAASGDVVVVTLNYRLGALGFLYGTGGLSGNYGFLDQQLAMRWVKDNIARFGGDAGNITLFGESAGAMSVGLHFVAPQSEALFNAAIIESNPWLPYRYIDATNPAGAKLQANFYGRIE